MVGSPLPPQAASLEGPQALAWDVLIHKFVLSGNFNQNFLPLHGGLVCFIFGEY